MRYLIVTVGRCGSLALSCDTFDFPFEVRDSSRSLQTLRDPVSQVLCYWTCSRADTSELNLQERSN